MPRIAPSTCVASHDHDTAKLPHFLASYRKYVAGLLLNHDEHRAMSLAVGGDFETVGVLEYCLLLQEGLKPEHTLVDVGCGSGRLAYQMKDYLKGTYVGIDVVPELLRYATNLRPR